MLLSLLDVMVCPIHDLNLNYETSENISIHNKVFEVSPDLGHLDFIVAPLSPRTNDLLVDFWNEKHWSVN